MAKTLEEAFKEAMDIAIPKIHKKPPDEIKLNNNIKYLIKERNSERRIKISARHTYKIKFEH